MTQNDVYFQVVIRSENAVIPKRSSDGSAGYDLSSSEEKKIPAKSHSLVDTGLSLVFPKTHYARIAPRSGLAVKNGIDVGAGVIDSDYTGIIKIVIFNHSEEDFSIKIGDRIAQILLIPVSTPNIEVIKEIPETARGENGFGSTGI